MRSQENPYFSRKKIICLIINFSPPKSWGSDSYWTIYYIVASLPKTTELGRSALILPELLTLSTSVLWTIQVTLVLLAAHAPHCHFFPMIKQRSWTCTRSQRRPLETVLPLKSRGTFYVTKLITMNPRPPFQWQFLDFHSFIHPYFTSQSSTLKKTHDFSSDIFINVKNSWICFAIWNKFYLTKKN